MDEKENGTVSQNDRYLHLRSHRPRRLDFERDWSGFQKLGQGRKAELRPEGGGLVWMWMAPLSDPAFDVYLRHAEKLSYAFK